MLNFFKKRAESPYAATIQYLSKEPHLRDLEQIAKQIHDRVPVIAYRYKEHLIHIINEESAIYHIVHTTAKMEKLAGASTAQNGGTLLDIGANIGLFTYFYKKKNPLSRVYLFEPDKRLVPVIKKNLEGFNNYEIIEAAVSDIDGELTFFTNPNSSQTNSTEYEAVVPFASEQSIVKTTVRSIKLSTFCNDRQIRHISTLKIDIQGGEYLALDSSKELLKIADEALVEICFLMPNTIPLIKLMDNYYKKHQPISEIIMGADLKFYN